MGVVIRVAIKAVIRLARGFVVAYLRYGAIRLKHQCLDDLHVTRVTPFISQIHRGEVFKRVDFCHDFIRFSPCGAPVCLLHGRFPTELDQIWAACARACVAAGRVEADDSRVKRCCSMGYGVAKDHA